MKINTFTQSGEKTDPVEIKVADKFLKINQKLVAQVLYVEQNNLMRKNGFAKTKGEVSGGGKKPWKQKGTGRARAGSSRSPIFRGGGVTFGPRAIAKRLTINKKMKDLAFGQLFLAKLRSDEIVAIDNYPTENVKTRDCQKIAEKILPGKELIVIFNQEDLDACVSWRNIPTVSCQAISNLTLAQLKSNKNLVFSIKGIDQMKKRLS